MSRIIEITIPMCPPAELNPNGRPDRWSKARAVKQFRAASKYAAISHRGTCGGGPILSGAIHVHTRIGWGKGRKALDGDNALASCKSMFDGLTDAGIWGDDRYLIHHPVVQERDPERLGYTVVRIEADAETWEATA